MGNLPCSESPFTHKYLTQAFYLITGRVLLYLPIIDVLFLQEHFTTISKSVPSDTIIQIASRRNVPSQLRIDYILWILQKTIIIFVRSY